MKLDFYPHEWDLFSLNCGFTEEEKQIIELKRRHGGNWTNKRYAAELHIPPRTFDRRLQIIVRKIKKFI